MSLLLAEFLKWLKGVPKFRLVIGGCVLVVLLVALFQWQCGTSRLENKLEQKQDQVTEQKAVEKVAEEKATEKEEVSKRADVKAREDVKKAREARNADTRGTKIEDANRNRCLAYPDDPGCK
jgi:predicted Holliday junction resolvase-like endonuclease